MRKVTSFKLKQREQFINNLTLWLNKHDVFMFLNSNQNSKKKYYGEYDILAGVDVVSCIKSNENSFSKLRDYYNKKKDWIMGSLAYDLKNEIENLKSENKEFICFDNMYFFQPKIILIIKNDKIEFHHFENVNANDLFKEISSIKFKENIISNNVDLNSRETKKEYLQKIKDIKKHIQLGDIYELNYCQEFYSEGNEIDPVQTYSLLNSKSLTPFSCFLKYNEKYLISSTPERYIKGFDNIVISQPIKGTSKRYIDEKKDKKSKEKLLNSKKEMSENIMTVDLVRNDLARIAKRGSVEVEELCGLYTFRQVHQLVSTIKCKLDKDKDWVDVLEKTFPMGSMTGTPKIKSMELIEKFENFKRGIFSGTVGYIDPKQRFDFNVIIRSIIYDSLNKKISVPVGGAITAKSNPKQEYDECMIKSEAMFNSLI